MVVHLVGGYDCARTGPLSLGACYRVQVDKVDVEPVGYHFHSASSQLLRTAASGSRSSSSRLLFMSANRSSHPHLGPRDVRIINSPLWASSSTSPPSSACARRSFGMRTPRELPILIIRALLPTPIAASVTEVWTHCTHLAHPWSRAVSAALNRRLTTRRLVCWFFH